MLKPKFCISDYSSRYVMYCANETEFDKFCEFLHEAGRRWCNNEPYIGNGREKFKPNSSCFRFHTGKRGSLDWYEENGYEILSFSDFNWEEFPVEDVELSYDSLFYE